MKTKQLQDAKAHLSEYVHGVEKNGPIEITVRGKGLAVLVSKKEWEKKSKKKESLVEFFRNSPLYDSGINLEREQTPVREVDL